MNSPTPSIRRATLTDAALLAEMGARTFADTFAADTPPEDMAAYLNSAFSPEKQAAELTDPASLFLIAEIAGQPAGYARLYAGEPLEGVTGARPIELVRIYSTGAWIGRGVGAALMQGCLDEARRLGHDVIWLGVWERNPRAQTFYQKWGFSKVGTHIFPLGDDPQTDWIMQRWLDYAST